MNRPQKYEYWVFDEAENDYVFIFDAYERDIEKYCDGLEKALDNACSRIVEYEVLQCRYVEKDAVKEWALKYESL